MCYPATAYGRIRRGGKKKENFLNASKSQFRDPRATHFRPLDPSRHIARSIRQDASKSKTQFYRAKRYIQKTNLRADVHRMRHPHRQNCRSKGGRQLPETTTTRAELVGRHRSILTGRNRVAGNRVPDTQSVIRPPPSSPASFAAASCHLNQDRQERQITRAFQAQESPLR